MRRIRNCLKEIFNSTLKIMDSQHQYLRLVYGIRLSHFFEILGISNEKPSISTEVPSISIKMPDFSNQKF